MSTHALDCFGNRPTEQRELVSSFALAQLRSLSVCSLQPRSDKNYSACNLQMNTNTSHEATPLSDSTSQGILLWRKCVKCFRISLLQLPACLHPPTPTQTGHGSRYERLSSSVRISCLRLCSVQDMMPIDERNCGTAEQGSNTTKSQYAATILPYTRLTTHTKYLRGF